MTQSSNAGWDRIRLQRNLGATVALVLNLGGLAVAGGLVVVETVGAQMLAILIGLVLVGNILLLTTYLWTRRPGPVYEEAFVSLILNSVDAAITVYDPAGRLLRANKGAERLSGFTAAELLQPQTWRHILPENEFDRVDAIVSGRRADEYPIINENHWVAKSGERRLLRWSNVALKDTRGRISLLVCIGFDITAQRQFEADLIMAKNEAELANRAKSEFLANMSHELRTPLNAILGFSEIIRDQRLTDDLSTFRRYATDIHDSGQLLLQLINDILDMAKLESGRIDLEEREIDLPAIISIAHRLVERKAIDGHVDIVVDVAPNLPPLLGGERALKQITLNLLSNAVKFTPAGGRATVSAKLNDSGGIEISVSDTGIGIPEASLEKLFQPFYQVDAKISRRYGGTGLGLAITKKLVDAHGAQIAVTSAPDKGTRVTVSFPPSRTLHAFAVEASPRQRPGAAIG
ncbi:sensor histidine kinase [Dongia sp.]|uniref:sensor histidine kinase n=1 Tax=Dongia sp. TaxID=1977262 RepID=UPI0035B179F7